MVDIKNCKALPPWRAASLSHVFVYRPAADNGAHGTALHPRLIERCVAAFRFQLVAIEDPRHVRIDHGQIGWRAAGPATAGRARQPPGRPSNPAGRLERALSKVISFSSPLCTRRKPAGSMVSMPMAPAAAS